jgi:hypothetical protein
MRLVRKAPTLTEFVKGEGCFVIVGTARQWMANSADPKSEYGMIDRNFMKRFGSQKGNITGSGRFTHGHEKTLPERAVVMG